MLLAAARRRFRSQPISHPVESQASPCQDTSLAEHLIATLGRGATSCADLQAAAAAAVKESRGCCSDLTKKLAKIGSSGRHPQNAERDLFRALQLPIDIHFVEIDVKDMTDPKHKTAKMRVPLLMPHELLHFLSATDKINVVESDSAQYWEHYRNYIGPHPALDVHDRNPASPWHQPIGVSGDDARYTLAGRKIIIMMLSYVLQRKESLDLCRFPFFILRHEVSLGFKSLAPIFRIIAWSLNVAFAGKWPSCDCEGRPLRDPTSNRRAGSDMSAKWAVTEFRGDWKL